MKYTSFNGGIEISFQFMVMSRNVTKLKYVVYMLFILVFIFHSIAANNKELSSEHLNIPGYLHNNKIFVEQNHRFGIACNSSKKIKACSISSPYNALFSINHEFNQSWYEGGRIFISIKDPYSCIATVDMANASDTGEWKCILPVKGIKEGYVNEYKMYNVSVVSCKNTYFFIYVPISIIFCMLVVIFRLYTVYCESPFAECFAN